MGLIEQAFRRKVKTPVKRAARQQVRKVSVKCEACGKRYTNPLAHTCAPKSDFKRRKAAEERQRKRDAARKKRQKQAHDYTTCGDDGCKRALCAAYRAGHETGDAEGYERGWQQGFASGIASCPRDHK